MDDALVDPCTEQRENEAHLRRRITNLEEELAVLRKTASNEVTEVEDNTSMQESAKGPHDVQHAYHIHTNLRTFGETGGVVFVETHGPQKTLEECADIVETFDGHRRKLGRFLVRYNVNEFVRPPVLHQWLENGKVYRSPEERESSKFELFFDLLFVGIVHQIAEAAADQPTGAGLAKYVLTFCPAYSIWADLRDIVNSFGRDDVPERIFILWIMVLLVGYSNNASAIAIKSAEEVANDFTLAAFNENSQQIAIRWALGFLIVAKVSKVILLGIYAYFLSPARKALLAGSLNSAIACLLFFVALFVPLHAQIVLVALGILSEMSLRVIGVGVLKLLEYFRGELGSQTPEVTATEEKDSTEIGRANVRRTTSGLQRFAQSTTRRLPERMPAINIEHHVDRLGAFTTIVMGEMVVNIFLRTSSASELSRQAGRSFLALMLAFNLNWLYFDSDGCGESIHPLRRSWLTSVLFTYLHLPLAMALLLASSATSQLVANEDVDTGLVFFFGTGVGICILIIACIGLLHKNVTGQSEHERQSSQYIRRRFFGSMTRLIIMTTRFIVGGLMSFLPFAHDRMDSMQILAIYAGLTASLIAEEILARVEERHLLEVQTEPDEEGPNSRTL